MMAEMAEGLEMAEARMAVAKMAEAAVVTAAVETEASASAPVAVAMKAVSSHARRRRRPAAAERLHTDSGRHTRMKRDACARRMRARRARARAGKHSRSRTRDGVSRGARAEGSLGRWQCATCRHRCGVRSKFEEIREISARGKRFSSIGFRGK